VKFVEEIGFLHEPHQHFFLHERHERHEHFEPQMTQMDTDDISIQEYLCASVKICGKYHPFVFLILQTAILAGFVEEEGLIGGPIGQTS